MKRSKSATSFILTLVMMSFPCWVGHADSVLSTVDARSLGMGEARRAEAFGTAATSLNPSGLSLNKQFVFEGGYSFNNKTDDKLIRVAACDSTVPVGGCFFYNYQKYFFDPDLGVDDQSAHVFGATSSRALSPQFHIGFTMKYVNFQGASEESGFASDVGVTLELSKGIRLAGVGYNLYHSFEHPEFERAFAGAVSVRPGNGALAVNGDAYWNTEREGKSGRYSAGAEYYFSPSRNMSYPIRVGVIRDRSLETSYINGGFGLQTKKIGLDIGLRRQVGNGDEWLFQGALNLLTLLN